MSMYDLTAVRFYSQFAGPRLMIMIWIADAVRDESGTATIGRESLADACRLHPNSISQYMRDLVREGELIILRSGKKNSYIIPIFPDEPGYAPTACTIADPRHVCNKFHTPLEVARERKKSGIAPRSMVVKSLDVVKTLPVAASLDVVKSLPTGSQIATSDVVKSLPTGSQIATLSPVLPHLLPQYIPQQRARAHEDAPSSNGNHALQTWEETPEIMPAPEIPSPPPPPPLPAPDVPEARLAWREVRQKLRHKVGQPVVDAWGTQCHLYEVMPGLWRLQLGPGIPLGMFRSRFETLIIDALAEYAQAGNQILEIVKAS